MDLMLTDGVLLATSAISISLHPCTCTRATVHFAEQEESMGDLHTSWSLTEGGDAEGEGECTAYLINHYYSTKCALPPIF